ncbi:MAG: hypothetical protein FJ320_08140 [SAR202 cluster bacterium]|nr:hypothetical protein [SAR202 cluster bacterium]
MTDLSKNDVKAMGKAVGLDIKEPDLSEVTEVINAIIEAVDEINPPGLDAIEPLPVIPPPPRPKSLATGTAAGRQRRGRQASRGRAAPANGRRTRGRASGRAASGARTGARRAKTSRSGR